MASKVVVILALLSLVGATVGAGCPVPASSTLPTSPRAEIVYLDFGNNGLPADNANAWPFGSSGHRINASFSLAKLMKSSATISDAEAAQRVQANVESFFEGYDICFVNSYQHQEPNDEHSTIYIGRLVYSGTDNEQGTGGHGQAENTDYDPERGYNTHHSDIGVVYAHGRLDYPRSSVDDALYNLARITSHEIGHLLGLDHTSASNGDIMNTSWDKETRYAASFVSAQITDSGSLLKGQVQDAPAILLAVLGPFNGRQCAEFLSGPAGSPVETITVQSRLSNGVMSSTSLQSGATYWLLAEGVWHAGHSGQTEDAEWWRSPPDYADWTEDNNWNGYPPDSMDLIVDNALQPDWWGSPLASPSPLGDFSTFAVHTYSPSHMYWLPIVGDGTTINLRVLDHPSHYGDNSGSLTVKLYASE